eukprot:6796515-Alexandrium_andersonii.AAC.1
MSEGSWSAEANGKGAVRRGGPSPRVAARFASRCARARASVHGHPARTCRCLATERMEAAER